VNLISVGIRWFSGALAGEAAAMPVRILSLWLQLATGEGKFL
jgi:hypothetical protein